MYTRQQEYYIALNMVQGLGPVLISRLLKYFSSPEHIFQTSREELIHVAGISVRVAEGIKSILNSKEFADELSCIKKGDIQILCLNDTSYPAILKEIYDPPAIIYIKGDQSLLNEVSIAVVGCRRATFYGKQQAERIGHDLSSRGICVISGLARGIDTAAHKGALKGLGRTVAVLGSGIEKIYPPENLNLFKQISQIGAVISEFPIYTAPHRGNFPRRNRIISGLSRGVVVVEAAKSSGSLITANLALSQNREVFAVPGAANSINARGTNKLIKEGAKLVENVDDIIEELNLCNYLQKKEKDEQPALDLLQENFSPEAKRLFEILSSEPMHIDLLIKSSSLTPSCVYKNLLELQLKGLVTEVEGKRFAKKEGYYGT